MADTAEKTFADLGKVKHSWSGIVAHDYVAFTPALLYWGTTLDRDLVRDFAATLDKSTRILGCDSPMPIFKMTNPIREMVIQCGGASGEKKDKIDLSRRLYFCPKSLWEKLRDHLTRFAFCDPVKKEVVVAVECPVMQIPDYTRLADGIMPPGFIPVSSISVYGTSYGAIWRWNSSNLFEKPTATRVDACELARKDGLMFLRRYE